MTDTYTIWSNKNLDFDEWKNQLSYDDCFDKTDEQLYSMMYTENNEYLDDERMNLNIQLNRDILVIADIGRWNGRFSGYAEINSGNIKDCLHTECDYATWYVDKKFDLKCEAVHHDGTNRYLYRVYRDNATDTQIENLKVKLYNETATRTDITRVTKRLGDDIAKVYGFKQPKQNSMER